MNFAPRQAPKRVCIVPESEADGWGKIGINYYCTSSRHTHWTHNRTQAMVDQQQLRWVGGHKKVATWCSHWTWAKVYTRNEAGEVICCNMQLIRGNAK